MKTEFFKNSIRIAIGVTLFLLLLNFMLGGLDVYVFTDVRQIAVVFLYATVLTLVNYGFFKMLNKNYDWATEPRKLFLLGVLISIPLTVLTYAVCRFIDVVWIMQLETSSQFFANEKIQYYVFVLLISTAVSLFMHALYFYKALQERKVRDQKIIAETASAKFEALQNQLAPHFLFNNLNVLSALIDENPQAAQNFITDLSKIYRYVLEHKEMELVSLDKELKFAQTYINLLKKRFEESICCSIPEIASNPEMKIVPLSLQLTLENAVKHNLFSVEKPLQITIEKKERRLLIKNNLRPKNRSGKNSKIGLKNIKERYALITKEQVEITVTNQQYQISLPILKN